MVSGMMKGEMMVNDLMVNEMSGDDDTTR